MFLMNTSSLFFFPLFFVNSLLGNITFVVSAAMGSLSTHLFPGLTMHLSFARQNYHCEDKIHSDVQRDPRQIP